MARNLPYHIEHEPKLLSFTAWYAISKNNLFPEYDHICILEWDVVLEKDFLTQLQLNTADAISFIEISDFFLVDISCSVAEEYLKKKGISYPMSDRRWGASTNQCLRRSLLDAFVDWYYPSCLWIKEFHEEKFSWYHERMYMIFLEIQNIPYHFVDGLQHLMLNSHKEFNA
jgi:hypothetical protein